jgi:cytochrome P450
MVLILIFFTPIIAKFLYKWLRFIYLSFKIPKSSLDTSITGLYNLIAGDTKNFFKRLQSAYDVDGLTRSWLGPILIVDIKSPEDVKMVMNSRDCMNKPYFVSDFSKLSQGTLFGRIEKSHRKILNPYFGPHLRHQSISIVNEKMKIQMEILKRKEGKGEFNVFHNMTALNLEIILSLMELDVDIQNQEEEKRDAYHNNLVL